MQATFCAMFAEKGYQGATGTVSVIHNSDFYQSSPLSVNEQEIYKGVFSNPEMSENLFGKFSFLWIIFSHKWRWNEDFYNTFFKAMLALKNCHIKFSPLQGKDQEYFCGVHKHLYSTWADLEGNCKCKNDGYVSWRRQRMQEIARNIFEDDDSNLHFSGPSLLIFCKYRFMIWIGGVCMLSKLTAPNFWLRLSIQRHKTWVAISQSVSAFSSELNSRHLK